MPAPVYAFWLLPASPDLVPDLVPAAPPELVPDLVPAAPPELVPAAPPELVLAASCSGCHSMRMPILHSRDSPPALAELNYLNINVLGLIQSFNFGKF